MSTFRELLEDEIKDLYDAENRIKEALPKMKEHATSQELKKAFADHLEETKQQIARLEKIGEHLDINVTGETCEATKGLVEEGEDLMEEFDKGDILDAALIGAAQKVEHYEMASYGTAREFAETLGLKEVEKLLSETLDEEGETNKKLTKIARGGVNKAASEAQKPGSKKRAERKQQSRQKTSSQLEEKTVDELYEMAKEQSVDGRSKMNKKELITALS